ncbi:MAG: DUF669 domain-containing protein [Phycisphaerales bacterium]|nr:DUF669 domain-containing protein [Phycisphaerales bacterium]
MAQMDFDANQHEPAKELAPIPEGKYPMIATASELKTTSSGNGNYLAFTYEVIDGQYKGRKLWHNFTRQNANADAVRIGNEQLSAFCRAVNVMQPRDSAQLHNIPFIGSVGVKKREDTKELKNVLKGWDSRASAAVAAQQPAASGATAPAGSAAPWKK